MQRTLLTLARSLVNSAAGRSRRRPQVQSREVTITSRLQTSGASTTEAIDTLIGRISRLTWRPICWSATRHQSLSTRQDAPRNQRSKTAHSEHNLARRSTFIISH
jgi:hypothetical protein